MDLVFLDELGHVLRSSMGGALLDDADQPEADGLRT
ncbi:hypothetical protein FHS28_004295 [Roseateles terrae]|uniref:Uncharacterized protein n=1 Tax=Roseateles terrae TaxID=431060 RepID=A0ABR6GXT3_9BURK|nr:hypothetical protein [Roseateles terrae]